MFGSQPLGSRGSAPSAGFGSSSREQAAKVFQGQGTRSCRRLAYRRPGRRRTARGSVGKQSTRRRNDPTWKFGGAERFSEFRRHSECRAREITPSAAASAARWSSTSSSGLRRARACARSTSAKTMKALHGVSSPGPQVLRVHADPRGARAERAGLRLRPTASGTSTSSARAQVPARRLRPRRLRRQAARVDEAFGAERLRHEHARRAGEAAHLEGHEDRVRSSAGPGPMAYSLPGSTGIQHATAATGAKRRRRGRCRPPRASRRTSQTRSAST